MYKLHTLQPDTLLSLPVRRGASLSVETGAIWFTLDGRDIIVTNGQHCELEYDAMLLIESFSHSRFRLTEPAAPGWIKAILSLPERLRRNRHNASQPVIISGSVKA